MPSADVFIQAGHEGRRSGATGATGPLGDEIEWTPIVADEATRILRSAGVSVIREDAELQGIYDVKVAIFIHFDSGNPSCSSGSSVGYNDSSDRPAASEWKSLYSRYWPFRWMPDNFTSNLSGYYGFSYTRTSDAEFVIELGEISCREQAEWLQPRLKWLGSLIAHFLSKRIDKGNIPDPGSFSGGIVTPASWSTFYSGIDLDGFSIPRKGQRNRTLIRALGLDTEPFGEVITHQNRQFIKGKVSWFGGFRDRTMAPDETVALTGEVGRQLSENDYYAAMRWDYRGQKSFWVNRHLLVLNPVNDKSIIVRSIDWGPNTSTERVLDLSNISLDYLGVETDDELICAFSNSSNSNQQVGPI